MNLAPALRQHTADLLAAVGPDAPTLCEGWNARDLAAHLVIRDRRPDAMPGIMLERFAGHTAKVQDGQASQPYETSIELLRQGPPRFSPMRLPALDQRVNTAEYAIHAEDVRRAQPDGGATLTPLPEGTQDAVRAALPMMARMVLRRCPVTVVALLPGQAPLTLVKGDAGGGEVTLTGEPIDVLLHLSGRERSGVEVGGDAAACARFAEVARGL